MQVLLVQYLQTSPFKNKTTKFKEGREKFYTSTKLKKKHNNYVVFPRDYFCPFCCFSNHCGVVVSELDCKCKSNNDQSVSN